MLQLAVSTRFPLLFGFREYQYQTPPYTSTTREDLVAWALPDCFANIQWCTTSHGGRATSRLDDKADAAQTHLSKKHVSGRFDAQPR